MDIISRYNKKTEKKKHENILVIFKYYLKVSGDLIKMKKKEKI